MSDCIANDSEDKKVVLEDTHQLSRYVSVIGMNLNPFKKLGILENSIFLCLFSLVTKINNSIRPLFDIGPVSLYHFKIRILIICSPSFMFLSYINA